MSTQFFPDAQQPAYTDDDPIAMHEHGIDPPWVWTDGHIWVACGFTAVITATVTSLIAWMI